MAQKSSLCRCPHCGESLRLSSLAQSSAPTTFESTSAGVSAWSQPPPPDAYHHGFWDSDGIKYTLAGGFAALVILVAGWWFEADSSLAGVAAAITALAFGVGLHVLKLYWWSPAQPEPTETSVTFRGEFRNSDDGTYHIDELDTDGINHQKLIVFCQALMDNGFRWIGRPKAKLYYGVTRGQHEKIRLQFDELLYLHPDGRLTSRGRLFVRKIASYAGK